MGKLLLAMFLFGFLMVVLGLKALGVLGAIIGAVFGLVGGIIGLVAGFAGLLIGLIAAAGALLPIIIVVAIIVGVAKLLLTI